MYSFMEHWFISNDYTYKEYPQKRYSSENLIRPMNGHISGVDSINTELLLIDTLIQLKPRWRQMTYYKPLELLFSG